MKRWLARYFFGTRYIFVDKDEKMYWSYQWRDTIYVYDKELNDIKIKRPPNTKLVWVKWPTTKGD